MTDKERLEQVKDNERLRIHYDSDKEWLIEQAEKVQELEKELHKAKCKLGNKNKYIKTLNGKVAGAYNHLNRTQNDRNAKHNVLEKWRPQMKAMREALEFYADKENYEIWRANLDPELDSIHNVDHDAGCKARKTLEELK